MKKSKTNLIIKIALVIFMTIGQPFLVVGRFYMEPSEYYLNHSLTNIQGEVWKDIIGFEGLYQISNMGRVKSLKRIKHRISYNKDTSFIHHEQIIKTKKNQKVGGYLQFKLFKNAIGKQAKVHILVARHFIENPNEYPIVNHKKGIKTDNRAEELEWCTYSQNSKHSFDIGLQKPTRTRKVIQLTLDGEFVAIFESRASAGRSTGINPSGISLAIFGKLNHSGGFKWINA